MRKKLIFLLTILLVAFIASCGSSNKIKIATEGAYPPFSQVESDGSVVGFDVDIANALCEAMKAECEIVLQDWDGMIPGLLAKKYDAIVASMSITEERKEKVNFTDKYYATPNGFAGRVNSGLNITKDVEANKEVLRGLKVGVQQSTVSDNYITDNYSGVLDIRRYGKQEEANLDLAAGRVDLLFADIIPLAEFVKLPENSDFELIGETVNDTQWFGDGVGIAIRKEDNELLSKFNMAIKQIRDSGKYQEIQSKYFDFDIYGD